MSNITTWLLRGDCHGYFGWMKNRSLDDYLPEQTAIIILGDAGINFWLNERDRQLKEELESKGFYLYCLRGNHEERPQAIKGMKLVYDDNVDGNVYIEEAYPHIRYFKDFGIYHIDNFNIGVVGGAYSIDKWYRLMRAGVKDKFDPKYMNPKVTGWFPLEQLDDYEMEEAAAFFKGKHVDFMFTHTCPIEYQPTDLFLSGVDQSSVDNSMELFLSELKDSMSIGVWCFGHYHADRLERPYVEQYYNDIEELQHIWNRWDKYKKTGELDWWLTKAPGFYMS